MHRVKVHLFRGSGFIGWAIRWRTWRKYAHVAIQIDDTLYEASESPFPRGCVQKTNMDEFEASKRQKPTLTLVPTETLTKEETQAMLNFLEEAVGKKYDYMAILAFVSRTGESIFSKKTYFCSELACEAFRWVGKPLFFRLHCRKVSPGLVANSIRLKELR